MGRRASKKIGAGRGRKAAAAGDDDDYDPGAAKKGKSKAKAAPKVETKSHQRFAEMFSAKPKPKPKSKDEDEDDVKSEISDDDLAAFTAKSAPKKSESVEPSETARGAKRAAAAKPRTWIVDESDSDGEAMLGDIDNMVKGIGNQSETSSSKGRVSLFSMSQSGAGKDLPKTKTKLSRTFDFSDDDTNYEMLAKSSPRKSIKGDDDDIDQFLSDEGFQPPATKAATANSAAPKAPKPVAAPKKRGRPPAASKAKPEKKEAPSPAAKAHAKKTKPAKPASDDEEEEESIAPRRPARAARTTKAKPKYFDSDDEDDTFQAGGDESDDPFGMDSD